MGDLTWRKSTYSGTADNDANCVELASQGAARDSKNPGGPVLNVEVTALVAAVKAGQIA
jgi:uncharacterized protein DUF397